MNEEILPVSVLESELKSVIERDPDLAKGMVEAFRLLGLLAGRSGDVGRLLLAAVEGRITQSELEQGLESVRSRLAAHLILAPGDAKE